VARLYVWPLTSTLPVYIHSCTGTILCLYLHATVFQTNVVSR
jgi:hypothetical protein